MRFKKKQENKIKYINKRTVISVRVVVSKQMNEAGDKIVTYNLLGGRGLVAITGLLPLHSATAIPYTNIGH